MRLLTRSLLTIFAFLFLFGCAAKQMSTLPSFEAKQFDKNMYASKVDNFLILFDASSSMYFKYNGMKFWMSHYAHRTWPGKGYGAIHIFGHSHGSLEDHGLSTDVGVDCSERLIGRPYSPISIDEIVEYMASKQNLHPDYVLLTSALT